MANMLSCFPKAGLTLEPRLQIALDVVEGIRFLHSQGLVHRDIKLKNVLVSGSYFPVPRLTGLLEGTCMHKKSPEEE